MGKTKMQFMQCDLLCAKLAKRKQEVLPQPLSVSLDDMWTHVSVCSYLGTLY